MRHTLSSIHNLTPQEKEKQPATLKVKMEGKEKWWSIGRIPRKMARRRFYRNLPNLNPPRRETPANVHTHLTPASSSATAHSSKSPRQSQHLVPLRSDQIRHH
ncbi:hypothetical protein BD410DRAFT_69138 [Rickenella mellea]|uniref:Uncharacterized protein n=1 Tax=Rickenella mellea TaxID=50990 RepID=A0A4Y7QCI8_9AGAM|nr:hypothetical protein BD410DRAFT_69138 [Rickenella mellea]